LHPSWQAAADAEELIYSTNGQTGKRRRRVREQHISRGRERRLRERQCAEEVSKSGLLAIGITVGGNTRGPVIAAAL
jgi:hypothetical protein